MRRFLVIGCGGSGGATVRYLMDELKATLARRGVPELPQAWQFLHIDVPTAPESGPGLLQSVRDQGGTYVGLSYPGAKYADMAATVQSKLREQRALDTVASWWPDPAQVDFPVVDGAGQFRAVGRVLTLATLATEIKPRLMDAWSRLNAARTLQEMHAVTARVPGTGVVEEHHAPLVFVVSSMAGGSGASMVLDVCNTIGASLPGVQADHIGLFLFTPDVFKGLAPAAITGVQANAAAALAELIAAQTGAAGRGPGNPEQRLLQAIGINEVLREQPFGRVFPVGGSIGDTGARLGDGEPHTVYRALGRGLSALMLSGVATEEFAAYDLVNQGMYARPEQFGWGEPANKVAWSCFGYANLSLGRDRYAEYAAQRLARTALDHLVTGHRQPGDTSSGTEQVRRHVDARWDTICRQVGLPVTGESAKSWFERLPEFTRWREQEAARLRGNLVDSATDPARAGDDLQQWTAQVDHLVRQRSADLQTGIGLAADRWLLDWQQRTVTQIEHVTTDDIGLLGLPFAVAVLERLADHLGRWAGELKQAATFLEPAQLPRTFATKIAALVQARGRVRNVDGLATEIRTGYQNQIAAALLNRCAALAAESMTSLATDMVQALAEACREGQGAVEHARASLAVDTGLAQLRTDDYASWPSDADQVVPERFAHAENEVLLTTAEDFPLIFSAHVSALDHDPGRGTAREVAAVQIITGRWPTVGAQSSPGGLILTESPWRSPAVQVDPVTGNPIIPRRGRYAVTVRAQDVLGRARQFVERPDQAFSRYIGESLSDHLSDPALPELERRQRQEQFVDRFHQALQLARPLIGMYKPAIEHLHGANAYTRHYKFSAIPVEGLAVRAQLRRLLETDAAIDSSALSSFEKSVEGESTIARIDVFGSYPSFYPLVFRSLLEPISSQWHGLSPHMRGNFWHWRRARALPAALPMGAGQRRAVVGGWLVGRLTGSVDVPADAAAVGGAPVRVLDPGSGRWVDFPADLVLTRQDLRTQGDLLVLLLESMSIAVADCYQQAEQQPLHPYTALRRIFDDSLHGPSDSDAINRRSGATRVEEWIATGQAEAGGALLGDAGDPELRRAAAATWLRETREGTVALRDRPYDPPFDDRPWLVDIAGDILMAVEVIEGWVSRPARLVSGPNL